MRITFNTKNLFFDRARVTGAVDRARRKVLSKMGAYVRQRARTSQRKRKKPSAPGSPPSSHEGSLRNLIFFAYDPSTGGVVVGPVRLNQVDALNGRLTRGTVPELHEYGGEMGIFEARNRDGTWFRWDKRRRPGPNRIVRWRKATYPARPFMQPALQAELPRLPALWANSVKAS